MIRCMSKAFIAVAIATIPFAAAAQPAAFAWEIGPVVRGENASVGMPLAPRRLPDGAVAFDFPIAGRGQIDAQIDAMTAPVRPLAGARQITLRYRIDAGPRTRFVADERPDERATVSLYLQQHGDTWTARGRYASYRWYVPGRAVVPLTPGVHQLVVRFDEEWTNVNGQPRSSDPRGYRFALQGTARIGLAFGSPSLRSHGVYATGPARFTLLGFDIE